MLVSLRGMQDAIAELAAESVTVEPYSRRNMSETVSFYFSVYSLKTNGLVPWRDQLAALRSSAAKDYEKVLETYLEQLIARYDHMIGRCDMAVQGASMAHQMVCGIPVQSMFFFLLLWFSFGESGQ